MFRSWKMRWIGPAVALMLTLSAAAEQRTFHATGPMEVDTKPDTSTAPYNHLTLTKHYHGGLEAEGTGEMLAGGGPTGTGGYVAMEVVKGTLDGKAGSFELMHWGAMEDGRFELRISVVPGSGTGALKGITGSMTMEIGPDHKQYYVLAYTLPEL
jgi:hypothetical protein